MTNPATTDNASILARSATHVRFPRPATAATTDRHVNVHQVSKEIRWLSASELNATPTMTAPTTKLATTNIASIHAEREILARATLNVSSRITTPNADAQNRCPKAIRSHTVK